MHACDRRTDRRHSKTVRMLSQLHGKNHWSDLHENSIKYVSVDKAELIKCWRSLLDTREDMKIEQKTYLRLKALVVVYYAIIRRTKECTDVFERS